MYSVGGKTVSVGNKFPENKVNTLTFQVKGVQFPDPSDSLGQFELRFNSPQTVFINYGDGSNIKYESKTNENLIAIRNNPESADANSYVPHVYNDENTNLRFITVGFEDLKKLNSISFFFCQLSGVFPIDINSAINLDSLLLQSTNNLEGFPESIAQNKKIRILGLGQAFANRLEKIPDAFFSMSLEVFVIGNAAILTDLISSNFFKINQLKDTLKRFVIRNNFVEKLPDSIQECILLENLDMYQNNFKEFPKQISFLENLKILRMGDTLSLENTEIPVLFNEKLEDFDVRFGNLDFLDIPLSFKNLKSLNVIRAFDQLVINNTRFNEFIDAFYELCTENGFLNSSSTVAQNTGFPEQFRNIVWGASSLTQTGAVEAPPQFVQGSNNGNPINQGQKIYVLVNNYGHTITTS
jgi:Leucine-rich repeat (LRR) protein